MMRTKQLLWYMTEDGVNLYDVFCAGIRFGFTHTNEKWTEDEWYQALEAALPVKFVQKLEKAAMERNRNLRKGQHTGRYD